MPNVEVSSPEVEPIEAGWHVAICRNDKLSVPKTPVSVAGEIAGGIPSYAIVLALGSAEGIISFVVTAVPANRGDPW
jgi:hypothetical protein